MKVLHVVPSLALSHGGVSTNVRELCRGLAGLGIEVALWSTRRGFLPEVDGPEDRRLEEAGVRLRYFSVSGGSWVGGRYAYSPALRLALLERVPQVDLVHIHALWLYPTWAASQACRRFQVPYVLSPHGALAPYGLRSRFLFKRVYGTLVEKRTLAGAEAVHFTSLREQRQAVGLWGITKPGAVIPCSIRTEAIPHVPAGSFRSRYPAVGDGRILLFLGRLHPKKRLGIVAETFAGLSGRLKDLHLVIAGVDAGAGAQARETLRRLGLLGRTTFTGFLAGTEKWAAYRDASLFLLPSLDENFGASVLESMAMGVPVLASPQVALAQEMERAGAGWIVEGDSPDWEKAAERLLTSPAQLQSMGEAGRRLVSTTFQTDRVAKAMKGFYQDLLERRKVP